MQDSQTRELSASFRRDPPLGAKGAAGAETQMHIHSSAAARPPHAPTHDPKRFIGWGRKRIHPRNL